MFTGFFPPWTAFVPGSLLYCPRKMRTDTRIWELNQPRKPTEAYGNLRKPNSGVTVPSPPPEILNLPEIRTSLRWLAPECSDFEATTLNRNSKQWNLMQPNSSQFDLIRLHFFPRAPILQSQHSPLTILNSPRAAAVWRGCLPLDSPHPNHHEEERYSWKGEQRARTP